MNADLVLAREQGLAAVAREHGVDPLEYRRLIADRVRLRMLSSSTLSVEPGGAEFELVDPNEKRCKAPRCNELIDPSRTKRAEFCPGSACRERHGYWLRHGKLPGESREAA